MTKNCFFPVINWTALSSRVLAVATTRIEGTWKAYIDAVPGDYFEDEKMEVLDNGQQLPKEIAIILFDYYPYNELPYDL